MFLNKTSSTTADVPLTGRCLRTTMYQVIVAMLCICLLSREASGMSVSQEEALMSVQKLNQELSNVHKLQEQTSSSKEEVKSSHLLSFIILNL